MSHWKEELSRSLRSPIVNRLYIHIGTWSSLDIILNICDTSSDKIWTSEIIHVNIFFSFLVLSSIFFIIIIKNQLVSLVDLKDHETSITFYTYFMITWEKILLCLLAIWIEVAGVLSYLSHSRQDSMSTAKLSPLKCRCFDHVDHIVTWPQLHVQWSWFSPCAIVHVGSVIIWNAHICMYMYLVYVCM